MSTETEAGSVPQDESATEPHMDLLQAAWGLIANAGWNAGTGDVDLAKSLGWHEAAVHWRDDYHRWLDLHLRPGGHQTWEQLALSLTGERDALSFKLTQMQGALRDVVEVEPIVNESAASPQASLDRGRLLKLISAHTGMYGYPVENLADAILAMNNSEDGAS